MGWEILESKHKHLLSVHFRGWEVEAGWEPLVDEMLSQISVVDPNVKVTQIKEKLGLLRVYVEDKHNESVRAVLLAYEEQSGTLCDMCGGPGQLIRENGWARTRCPDHDD